MKIPFHAQIRNAEPKLAAELDAAVNEIVVSFAASREETEESFLLAFDESSRPCRLRAAEAARSLAIRLAAIGSRLHGWALLIDAGSASADDALRVAKRLWFGIQGDGLYVSARSKAYFADYFLFGPAGQKDEAALGDELASWEVEGRLSIPVLDAIYARPALVAAGGPQREEEATQAIESLVDTLSEIGIGDGAGQALAVLGPGRGPASCVEAAIQRLYAGSAGHFLRVAASVVESSPYGPLARSLASIASPREGMDPGGLLSRAERGLLEELGPMLDFICRSPYRRDFSPQVSVRLRLCAAAALRLYARGMRAQGLPALLILDRVECLSEASLELLLGLVAESLGGEGLTVLAVGTELPRHWRGSAPRSLLVAGPSPAAVAQSALRGAEAMFSPSASASLALASAGDPLRLNFALRLLASGRNLPPSASTEELATQVLATFPGEYAELLLALRLGEDVLTDEAMEGFLRDSGYVPGIRAPVYRSLLELGFIEGGGRPRISSGPAARKAEAALRDGGTALRADFAARLLLLRGKGEIVSSIALYRRTRAEALERAAETALWREDTGLLLDCIQADAVYGRSEPPGSLGIGSTLEPLIGFFSAYAKSERPASFEALRALEAGGAGLADKLAEAAISLAKASFEYADGKVHEAANRAKNALISLHALGAQKLEARAHRILGLCSLAQEQVQEGADYLSNSFDLAALASEPLECILAATAEAAACFSLGDLGRASSRAEAAATWAAASFRADWESVCEFIKGRAALEIGRYGEAEDDFGRVRTIARVYGQDEAAHRAEIWIGRAAAFAGEAERAREILQRHADDVEALWFLGELETWEGDARGALARADAALALVPPIRFSSADAFGWDSGFASLEGRAVGFCGKRSYLLDQVSAFREYAAGMADPEKEGLASAARLADMAREDRLAAIHPSAHLYLFYRYVILERVTPSSMDGATALSKAFKALQLRSKRMGEASLKDGFLETNRWNKALIEAARARKLI